MKRIIYIVSSLCIMMAMLLPVDLKANSLISKVNLIEPYVYAKFPQATGTFDLTIGYIHVNDQLVYCVEPYKLIDSNELLVESSLLSDKDREQISIISYNGYNQKERKSDKWYMATQIMIWEYLGHQPKIVNFDEYGSYKKQIQNNIDTYLKLPSFDHKQITLKKGEKVVLEDTNNVFSKFAQIVHDGKAVIEKISSKLQLLTHSNAYEEGRLEYKRLEESDMGLPIVYRSATDSNVQNVIYPKIQNNVQGKITYRVQSYGKVHFKKSGNQLVSAIAIDSEDGIVHQLQFMNGPLKDVQANIYAREDIKDVWGNVIYTKDMLVDSITSHSLSKELPAGSYYLKEMKTREGYVLDTKQYDFKINNDSEEMEIVNLALDNQRAKVQLQVQKVFEEGSLLDLEKAYEDVVFAIYTNENIYSLTGALIVEKGAMVYRSGIDVNGNLIEPVDLPLGSYYLQELHTNIHFDKDETQYQFEVKENGSEYIPVMIQQGQLENKLHRNELRINKYGEAKKPLQARFVLYDANMNEIEEFVTDKKGEYVFEGLVDGVYFLQEIEAPEGYKLNNKIHKITLNEDFVYKVKNDKHVIQASIETKDVSNHKTFEVSMLASLVTMYTFLFRKLVKL